jgi:MFS family permease
VLQRLGFPRVGEHKRFVGAIVVDTIGSGLFMPITILYFLAVSPLTLVQIGAALSVSALITLPAALIVGSLVDRVGPRRMMLIGNLVQAAGMVAYLAVDAFWPLALWTAVLNIGRQCFWGSFGNTVTAITAPGERELWFGFLQAMRNLGYAVGGVLAGLAVQIGTAGAFHAVVLANAASFLVAWFLLLAVPDHRVPEHADASAGRAAGGWSVVVRDRSYLRLVVAQYGYVLSVMVLNFALPVYAAETAGLPGWVVGAIFTLNTVLVGLGQGLAVRAMVGRRRSRMMAWAHAFFAASYLMFILAGVLPVWLGIATVLLASAVYTCGELTGGPVLSAVAAEAAPDHLRGRYLSLFQLSWAIGGVLAPVAYAFLLDQGPDTLWLALLGVALVAGVYAGRLWRVVPAAALDVVDRAR